MAIGNFDDKLKLFTDPTTKEVHVDATGVGYGDVLELCIWIIQKQGPSDAAATQITTYPGRGGLQTATLPDKTKTWQLRAVAKSTNPLKPGFATAMGIGLFLDTEGDQQVRFWAQSVELVNP